MKTEEISGRGVPIKLPCGCYGVKSINGDPGDGAGLKILILKDKSRVCPCGKRWKLAWVEVSE